MKSTEEAYHEWAEIYNPRRTQKGYEAFLCAIKMMNQRENLMIKALEEISFDQWIVLRKDLDVIKHIALIALYGPDNACDKCEKIFVNSCRVSREIAEHYMGIKNDVK